MRLLKRRWVRVLGGLALLLVLGVGVALATGWTAMGTTATGDRLARMQASPQWHGGHFENPIARQEPPFFTTLWRWITAGSPHSVPASPPPMVARKASEFAALPADGLRVTWLGHSTLLVEIDGRRVLFDPVWGERTSPFTWMGPRRFHAPPLALDDLPPLDAVVISHDHYDHLDYPTIQALARRDVRFIVPLGVGAHLTYWGVSADRITELDWWGEHALGDVRLVATPARHFSGRFLNDKDKTLWAGFALVGPTHRAFYSGDTAMHPAFTDIGQRLGPFDVTMIESGAYNQAWADVHLGPEQAVEAHQMVGGKVMLPVHWGTFDLALHGWTEPMERVLVAAQAAGVTVVTPRPGESVSPLAPTAPSRWWPSLPWETEAQSPARSSGLPPKTGLTPAAG